MKLAILTFALALVALGCSDAADTQYLPVGSRCSRDVQCGSAPYRCTQDGYPGGYCDKPCATDGDCPADSWCYPQRGCRRSCQTDTDACRTSEGYTCVVAPGRNYCDLASVRP